MDWFGKNKRIYLDYAATTPIHKDVLSAMNHFYKKGYVNPGGIYQEGVLAAKKISECRRSVANLIGTTSDHVIFTRGGTESNNMAVAGVLTMITTVQSKPLLAGSTAHLLFKEEKVLPHVIISAIEHAAVLECVKDLQQSGIISLSLVPVNEQGIIDIKELKKLLRPETVLVSIMYVNNEIGTIQPIKEIAKLIRWHRKNLVRSVDAIFRSPNEGEKNAPLSEKRFLYPLLHTDAIQAANYLDINVERLGVDLMSLSGSKIYGPKSSGILYARNKELLSSLFHGGDQEFGLRAGTEDLAQVAGFTKALEIVRKDSDTESVRLSELRDFMIVEILKSIPDVVTNGSLIDRISNNVNISVPGISGERLVIELDACGISVASKSACKEDSGEASHVLTALRNGSSATDGAVRFTMGRGTQKADVQRLVSELVNIFDRIKDFEKSLTIR